VASDLLTFFESFYEKYPQYNQQDLYIFGESYAGHYVPATAALILKSNSIAARNLKGIGKVLGTRVLLNTHTKLVSFCQSACLSVCPSVCLLTCLSVCLLACLLTCLPAWFDCFHSPISWHLPF
jgi:hypothetical protein